MNIKHILFDNDGTLYKMKPDFGDIVVGQMVAYLTKKLNKTEEQIRDERKKLFAKYRVESTEFVFGKEYNLKHDEFVKETYLKIPFHKCGIKFDNKLRTTLTALKQPKSILTNNPAEFANKITTILGVRDLFEKIIGATEINFQLKPKKEAFLSAIEITKYNPKETLFIDDLPEHHVTAKELGMTTVLVGKNKDKIPDYIDHKIDDIYAIEKIVKGLKNV